MNKTRLESLSDGVFAIGLTLLIIEIHVPELYAPSDGALWSAPSYLGPLFLSYFVSFPIVFNTVPGLLNWVERQLRLNFDAVPR